MKSKSTATIFAFFLGGLGGHKFYLGETAAGDEPRRFGQRGHSKDEFFEIYGKTIREDIKHVPTQVEWRSKKMKPTVSGYTRQLEIRWSQMPLAFVNWAIDNGGGTCSACHTTYFNDHTHNHGLQTEALCVNCHTATTSPWSNDAAIHATNTCQASHRLALLQSIFMASIM